MKTCPWWLRWYHQRQRQADVLWLVPSIRRVAAQKVEAMGQHEWLSDAWTREVDRLTAAAFARHTALPGQHHWRCACAAAPEET